MGDHPTSLLPEAMINRMGRSACRAYIDEAGQRSRSSRSSKHFVLSAVIINEEDHAEASDFLGDLRVALRREAHHTLHWQNLKAHPQRLHAAKSLGRQPWTAISSVVVCKPHLQPGKILDDDSAYLYTLRFLLERLSWLARHRQRVLHYTLAHIVRFKLASLRDYERQLRQSPNCSIAWQHLSAAGGAVDQPSRVEFLQLADIAASSSFAAFEPDQYGNTEPRYLQELSPRLFRMPGKPLTSYGLKMHPWNEHTKAAYPWVAAL